MTRHYMDLAVIESRWSKKGNHSVRQAFDTLAGIYSGNPFNYHYEMFNDATSLQEIIPRVAQHQHIHYIYLATHGDKYEISGAGENVVSRTKLKNILKSLSSKQLIGLYFGSCGFGKQTQYFNDSCNLAWVAGFTKEVGWIDSAALDLFFWNSYYYSSVINATTPFERSENMLIYLLCLKKRIPYMFDEMGFQVSLRLPFKYKRGSVTFPIEVIADSKPFKPLFIRAERFLSSTKGRSGGWP